MNIIRKNHITDREIEEIKRLIRMGSTTRVISEAFGRSTSAIENIRFQRWREERNT